MSLEVIVHAKKIIKVIRLILIAVLVFVVSWVVGLVIWKSYQENKVIILTNNTKYEESDVLRLKIENKSENTLCFSTRIPYYLERKDILAWEEYRYTGLLEGEDLIIRCMEPGDVKAFELSVEGVSGLHRVSIPVCLDCELGDEFREDHRFYSTKFVIK